MSASGDAQETTRSRRLHNIGRWLLSSGAVLVVFSTLYFATLLRPQLFFSWSRGSASILVRSDEPVPESAAQVIEPAESRIPRDLQVT